MPKTRESWLNVSKALELYDTISDSLSIRDILLELYDTISDSISIRDILLGFI